MITGTSWSSEEIHRDHGVPLITGGGPGRADVTGPRHGDPVWIGRITSS
jgi:hypothetical protein